ncbi:MAG: glycosyltransferase family 39 protein [Devosia sp.]
MRWGKLTEERRTLLVLGAITLFGAAIRASSLTAQSLWFDEIVSWEQSRGTFLELLTRTAQDNYPPLQNILIAISMRLFGEGAFGIRLPALLLGIATVPAIYALTSLAGNRTAGLLAAFIVAVSPFLIWYSQEGRMYALLALSATVFGWSVLRYITAPVPTRPWWMLGSGVALLYSHYFGPLDWISILAGAGVITLVFLKRWRRLFALAAWQVIPALAFLPWAAVLLNRAKTLTDEGFWIPSISAVSVIDNLWNLMSGSYGMLLILIGLVALVWPRMRSDAQLPVPLQPPHLLFMAIAAVLPIVLGIMTSLLVEPVLLGRYIIGSLPPFVALAAIGLVRLAGRVMLRRLVVAAVTVFCLVMAYRYGWQPPKQDWRAAARVVASQSAQTDCVVVTPAYFRSSLLYYLGDPPTCLVTPNDRGDPVALPASAHRVIGVFPEPESAKIASGFPDTIWEREDLSVRRIGVIAFTRKDAAPGG